MGDNMGYHGNSEIQIWKIGCFRDSEDFTIEMFYYWPVDFAMGGCPKIGYPQVQWIVIMMFPT